MSFYLLEQCKTTAAYTAIPKKQIKLNLEECCEKLDKKGYEVIDAKVMIIAKKDIELTIYKSGKILVKTDSKKIAKVEVENAYKILNVG